MDSSAKAVAAKPASARSSRRIGAQNSAGREAILKAAIAVLQEEGAAGLTASKIARKADVKAHMVHYYFRSIEDLVIALIRQHGSLGLKNTARAIASDQPLRALWEIETSFKWMSVAMELSSIAVRREDMRAEMMRYIEDMRSLQAEGIGDQQTFLVNRPGHAHPGHGTQRGQGSDEDVGVIANPADRVVIQNQVAQRTAAQRGDDGHHQHAEQIHGLAPRHQRTGDGEHRNAEQVSDIEKRFHAALSG